MLMKDKIVAIEELDDQEMIDIEVDGDHYFLANGILTHNSSSDPGMEDTSESFGLPATADLMLVLVTTEELDEMGQMMMKQLKNRGNNLNHYRKFLVGVDKSKMRLYDVEESAQRQLSDAAPAKPQQSKDKFKGFT